MVQAQGDRALDKILSSIGQSLQSHAPWFENLFEKRSSRAHQIFYGAWRLTKKLFQKKKLSVCHIAYEDLKHLKI